MPSQEEIDDQLKLLATNRRSLAHLVRQAARYGGEAEAPTHLFSGLADTRAQIARIKGVLRGWGVPATAHGAAAGVAGPEVASAGAGDDEPHVILNPSMPQGMLSENLAAYQSDRLEMFRGVYP